jgi:16S rRNA C1402 (ribose-2'-O) methylase RsmI
MLSNKIKYSIQVFLMLIVFSFVLFNLVFKFIGEIRSESIKKKAEQIEKQKIKTEFILNIEDQYQQMQKLYQAKEYEKVIEIIKIFNQYEKSDYKDLAKIKKEIRLFYLKKKLDFIPKIHLNE